MDRSWLIERVPRVWALWAASRPSQLALIVVVYLLGTGMTTAGSPFVAGEATANSIREVVDPEFLWTLLAGMIALVPVAVAIHYANEYADADTDAITVRTPFSGGSGALEETGLPVRFLRTATGAACVVATGVMLVAVTAGLLRLRAVGLLLAGLVLGVTYSVPPVAFVRRGIGEPVNMALGGLLLPLYGISVVARPTTVGFLSLVPFTLVVGCNLLAVHWPDRVADATVGKRTLAVRWPAVWIRVTFLALTVVAAMLAFGLWWIGVFPSAIALAHLVAVPFLVWTWATLTRQESPLPAVAAMVALAIALTTAWWWFGIG